MNVGDIMQKNKVTLRWSLPESVGVETREEETASLQLSTNGQLDTLYKALCIAFPWKKDLQQLRITT